MASKVPQQRKKEGEGRTGEGDKIEFIDFRFGRIVCNSNLLFLPFSAPPKIVRWEEKIQYELDKPVRLYCEAQGNPRPSISIVSIKDGKQVQVDNQMLYGNGSVYAPVTFSKKADRLFACLAKNVAGKTRMTAEMFLHGKLFFSVFLIEHHFIRWH